MRSLTTHAGDWGTEAGFLGSTLSASAPLAQLSIPKCLFQQFVHRTYFSFFLDDCLQGGGSAVQMKDHQSSAIARTVDAYL